MATILPAKPIEKSRMGEKMFQSIETAQAAERQKALALMLQGRREDMALQERQSRMDLAKYQAGVSADLAKLNYKNETQLINDRSNATVTAQLLIDDFRRRREVSSKVDTLKAAKLKPGETLEVPEQAEPIKGETLPGYEAPSMSAQDYTLFKKAEGTDLGLKMEKDGNISTAASRAAARNEQTADMGLQVQAQLLNNAKQQYNINKTTWEQSKVELEKIQRVNKIDKRQFDNKELASKADFADIFFPEKAYGELSKEEKKAIDDKWDGIGGIYQSMYGMTIDRNTNKIVPAESISRNFFHRALGVRKVVKTQGYDEDMQVMEVTEPDPVIDTAMWLRKELTKQAVMEGDWAMVNNIDSAVVASVQLMQAGLQNGGEAGLVAFTKGTKGYELTDTGANLLKYGMAAAKGQVYTKLSDYSKDALSETLNDPNANNALPGPDGLSVEGRAALKAAVSMELSTRLAEPPLFPHIDLIDRLATKITGIKEKIDPGMVLPDTMAQSMASAGKWFSFFDTRHEAAKEKMDDKEYNLPDKNPFQGQSVTAGTNTADFSKPEYGSFYFGTKPMEGVPFDTEKKYRTLITDLMQAYANDPNTEGKLMTPETLENALISATSMDEEILTHFTARYQDIYNQLQR